MTRQYDNYADLITFSRSSGGTALRPISYGDELVTNGTFDSDISGWTTTGAGVSAASVSGELEVTNTSGTSSGVYQTVNVQQNKVYKISFTARQGTSTSGVEFRSILGAIGGTTIETTNILSTSQADYNQTIVIASGTSLTVYCRTFAVGTAYFDNISVKEVLFDQPNAPLTLFNHPAGIPRIEYDADGNVLGLLVEESRTNLITYSEDFTQWNFNQSGITAGATVSPSGAGASKLTPNATATSPYASVDMAFTSGQSYTLSSYVKAAEHSIITLRVAAAIWGRATFDLSSQTVTFSSGSNLDSYHIELVGNGWYRCSITITAPSTGTQRCYIWDTDETNDGTSGIYIWGAQLEQGAFPTSYIPTSGATATRSADVASIPVADFGYNQSEGTVVVEAALTDSSATNQRLAWLHDTDQGTYVEFLSISKTGAAFMDWNIKDDNVTVVNISGGFSVGDGQSFKTAFSFAENNATGLLNGTVAGSDTSCTIPDTIDIMYIGRGPDSTRMTGHIKSIKYYPRRLSNAQLVELTS